MKEDVKTEPRIKSSKRKKRNEAYGLAEHKTKKLALNVNLCGIDNAKYLAYFLW